MPGVVGGCVCVCVPGVVGGDEAEVVDVDEGVLARRVHLCVCVCVCVCVRARARACAFAFACVFVFECATVLCISMGMPRSGREKQWKTCG